MDERLATHMAPQIARGRRAAEGIRRPWRRRNVVAGLAFALLVAAGAGGGLRSLYDSMVGSSGGTRVQWDKATVLGLSQANSGYRVTVERAYADANQVMIAVSVVDAKNQASSQVGTSGASLVDDQGDEYPMTMGMSSPNDSSSAANLLWFRTERPLAGGERAFHLTLPAIGVRDLSTPPPSEDPNWNPWHDVPGPWAFDFTIRVNGASIADPKVTAEAAGVTLRLRDVSATDASIKAGLEIVTGAAAGSNWFPVGAYEHNGRRFQISGGMVVPASPLSFEASESTSDRSGDWVLRVDELVGDEGGSQVRLQGPWLFRFTLP
jgi:hypothetical protein